MVLSIAVLAGASLWRLRMMRSRRTHYTATQTVLEAGREIAAHLADHPAVRSAGGERPDWSHFSRLVRSLHLLEDGLQYVSVSMGDVTLFHEHTSELGIRESADRPRAERAAANVTLDRKILSIGSSDLPVVTFTAVVPGDDGATRTIEVALRRDTVAREEIVPSEITASMYRVSLITVIVAFALCILIVVWMMHRETVMEKQRREEEHLAFAGVMASGIVHDFRNPMSSLRLDMQMLQKETAKGETCERDRLVRLADRARGTIDRMDTEFREFLQLSRPPSASPGPVDLSACVRDCVALLKPRLDQKKIRVQFDVPDRGPHALADVVCLRRAIINVIANAEQFSPEHGSVSVRISRHGSRAFVDIRDTGPGIPRSERMRVFDMFVSTRPGGTGLGLFLAKTAVERCGGSISVAGGSEGGACMRISLRIAPEKPGQPSQTDKSND